MSTASFAWVYDVSAAAWIADRLHPFGQDAGSVVPEGFERYLRLFHPIEEQGAVKRWADVAERNGRIVHPEMQLHSISRPVGTPSPGGYDPGPGYQTSLRQEIRAALVDHLRLATSTPDDCWYCVWEGFGGMDHQGVEERVELSGRSYLLACGPLGDVMQSALDKPWDQSPNLWWPNDRSWIVATEIDYAWTYVGGSAALIDGILDDPKLEALPMQLTDRPFYDSDLLNASLDS